MLNVYCQIDYQRNYRFVYPCHWRSSKHWDNPRGWKVAYSRKGLIFPFYSAAMLGTTLWTYREKVSITSNPPISILFSISLYWPVKEWYIWYQWVYTPCSPLFVVLLPIWVFSLCSAFFKVSQLLQVKIPFVESIHITDWIHMYRYGRWWWFCCRLIPSAWTWSCNECFHDLVCTFVMIRWLDINYLI